MLLKQFAKRVLPVVAVVAPLLWLVLSAEGQRVADIAILSLKGGSHINLDFARLHPGIDEQGIREGLDAEFSCEDRTTEFGTRVCHAPLSAVNGTPAQHVSFFFGPRSLRAMKLIYQSSYHEQFKQQAKAMLGEPVVQSQGEVSLLQWPGEYGLAVLLQRLAAGEQEPAFLWIAGADSAAGGASPPQ